MKKILGVFVFLLLSMVLLFANGAAEKSTGTGSVTTNADGIKRGGTLNVITAQSPRVVGYTPEMTNNSFIQFLRCSYGSLLFYNEKGGLVSDLATKWTTDADAATITFTLRQGVQFSDGTPFNAAAVKWNIEEYKKVGRSEVNNVVSITCPDDYTVIIQLNKWISSALESIGFFVNYMSPTAVEKNGVDWVRVHSCGTGPFVVDSFEQGVSVNYVKNSLYWQAGKPYLDGIHYTIMSENTTMENAFLAGEADMLLYASADQIHDLEGRSNIILEQNTNGQGAEGMGIIPSSCDKKSPFYDARVRQAFCYAIDNESIVKSLSYGLFPVTNQWAVPGSFTYNSEVKGYPYDPEKAKELLKDAGYANGFDTKLFIPTGLENWGVAIADNLTKVGIRTKVDIVDAAKSNSYMTNGWDGIMMHYNSIGPDLGLYMGRHLDANGAYYAKGIQHPQECLDLLDQIRTAKDDKTKISLEWQLQSIIYDKYALFGKPLCVNIIATLKSSYVKGDNFGKFHTAAWTPQEAWLDK